MQRIAINARKHSLALIIGGIEDHGRVHHDLTNDKNLIQNLKTFIRVIQFRGQSNRTHLRACADLPVDLGMVAGDVFLNITVSAAHQMHQAFHHIIEGAIWPLIQPIED